MFRRVLPMCLARIAVAFLASAAMAQSPGDAAPEIVVDDAVADHMDAAQEAYADGRLEDSLAHYTAVVAAYGEHDRAQRAAVNIGYVLRGLDRIAEARQAFENVIIAFPGTDYAAEAQARLGYLALTEDDRDGARAAFEQTVNAYPGSAHAAEAQLRLGYLTIGELRATEDPDEEMALRLEAADAFYAAIEGSWDRPEIAADAYTQYAGLFFEWGLAGNYTFEEVRGVCRKVLEYFPAGETDVLATAQLMIAESYLFDDRPEDAYPDAMRVIDEYPEARTQTAFAHWVAGQALEQMKSYPDAIEMYQGVIEGDYDASDNFAGRDIHLMCSFRTAECLRQSNRCQEAHPWFRYVIRNWPTAPMARTARRALWLMPPAM